MLDPQLAEFLQEGLDIHIGTRNEHLEPDGARAVALRVERDGAHLLVYASRPAAARLMPNLRTNGQAAVSVARPTDDRACQVKGTFVSARPARADERDFLSAQWERYLRTLEAIGIPRKMSENWLTWPVVAIRLRATTVFNQTPGPGAGAALS